MKKSVVISLAAISMALGVTGTSFFVNKEIKETKAEQHADNFALYDYENYSGTYYDSLGSNLTYGLNGTLRTSLTTLIYPKAWYSYSGSGSGTLAEILQEADEDPTNPENMIYFYTRDSVRKNAASTWNREHCWPQSISGGCWGTSAGGGADLLHIRPTYPSPNSTRGNNKYGEVSEGTGVKSYESMYYGNLNSGKFCPLPATRGDAARDIMYTWVAYKNHYNNLPDITNVFESYNTLLKWHTEDKPDVLESHRNDVSEDSKQKNRNPFVDHPEYAWMIFGDQCSASVKQACMEAYPEHVEAKNLSYITVDTSNAKTSYKDYDNFDSTGIQVYAFYDDATYEDVSSKVTYNKTQLRCSDTTVRVSYTYKNTTKTKDISITVNPNAVTSISLDANSVSIAKDMSRDLTATVLPSNASNKEVIWTSSNSSVCTVNNGHLSAKTVGNCVITAKTVDGNFTATCNVTVTAGKVLSNIRIDCNINEISYADSKDQNKTIDAKVYACYSDSTEENITASATKNFVIDTRILGTQKITATYQTYSAEHLITVTNEDSHDNVGDSSMTGEVDDEFDSSLFPGTLNKYIDFSGVTVDSDAVYAGQSAKSDQSAIQLRTKYSNSGIVQTSSGGNVTKITLEWNSATSNDRKIVVYGKNTAYTTAADLYDSNKQGSKLGELPKGTNELEITGSYPFIGLRSASGALYLNSILISMNGSKDYNASPEDQAISWAKYFVRETRTSDICLADTYAKREAGLHARWSEFTNEYNWMITESKALFCTSNNSDIKEARDHYTFIIGKYNLTQFVNDGQDHYLSARKINYLVNENSNSIGIIIMVATLSVSMLGLCIVIKKRKVVHK